MIDFHLEHATKLKNRLAIITIVEKNEESTGLLSKQLSDQIFGSFDVDHFYVDDKEQAKKMALEIIEKSA